MSDPSFQQIRPGEAIVAPPPPTDAGLVFIGRIHTPWRERHEAPRFGSPDGPLCHLELFEPWGPALTGLAAGQELDVLYWLHLARRDLVLQCRHGDVAMGTFALRSPMRPNPIGLSRVRLEAIEGLSLAVRGLDCLDLTPLIDLKPGYAVPRQTFPKG
jgi:tRNA-Thr(GGU) m(6)t(6)A37 methyltransferase TsaA